MIGRLTRLVGALALATLPFVAANASAETADELVKLNIEARGGLEKLKSVKSQTTTGKMIVGGGQMEIPFVIKSARPNLMRMESTLQGKTMVQAYDGENAWMIMPFMGSDEPQKIPAEDAREMQHQADMDGPLVDWKEKGHSLEVVGKEELEGASAWKLKLTLKNGDVTYVYLDAASHLEIRDTMKRKKDDKEYEIEVDMSSFKAEGGMMMPHLIESKVGDKVASQIVIEKVELNTPVEAGIFKFPAKAEKPATAVAAPAKSEEKPAAKTPAGKSDDKPAAQPPVAKPADQPATKSPTAP